MVRDDDTSSETIRTLDVILAVNDLGTQESCAMAQERLTELKDTPVTMPSTLPQGALSPLHDRMIAILASQEIDAWCPPK